jgi:hypothetical protein
LLLTFSAIVFTTKVASYFFLFLPSINFGFIVSSRNDFSKSFLKVGFAWPHQNERLSNPFHSFFQFFSIKIKIDILFRGKIVRQSVLVELAFWVWARDSNENELTDFQ